MTCAICGRQLHHDEQHRTACQRCEHRIRAWLREIPRQLPLLQALLVRDTASPSTGRTHGRAHAPTPVREDVLTLLGPAAPGPVRDRHGDQSGPVPIHALIHAWADHIADDLDTDLPPLRPGHDYTRYLAKRLPYALTRPWIAEFHQDLGDLVRRIRDITRTEPRRHPLTAPCPGPDCQMFALIREDWADYIECEACGRLLTEAEYADHAAQTLPALTVLAVHIATSHTRAQTSA